MSLEKLSREHARYAKLLNRLQSSGKIYEK
jgi:hypothetical protein